MLESHQAPGSPGPLGTWRAADLLAAHGPFQLHLATQIGAQLGDALAAEHAKGLVHGDITPGNVLIDAGWNATLTEFGASPETARAEHPATADVYSLGTTIYTFIGAGQQPLPVNAGPLTTVLASMTNPDPAQRPSAAQARDMLLSAAHQIAAPQPSATSPAPVAPAGQRGSVVVPVVVTSVVLLLIAAVVGAVLLIPRARHPEAAPPDKYLPQPTLVDACALAKAPDYALFGTVNYPFGLFFGSCNASIILNGGGIARVNFRMFGPQPLVGTPEQRGDLTVFSPTTTDPTQCYREVVLPDRNIIEA